MWMMMMTMINKHLKYQFTSHWTTVVKYYSMKFTLFYSYSFGSQEAEGTNSIAGVVANPNHASL